MIKRKNNCMSRLTASFLFPLTYVAAVIFTILVLFDGFDLRHVAEGMEWAFLIFPLFALSHSLSNMNIAVATQQVCDSQCALIPNCTPELLCRAFPQCCSKLSGKDTAKKRERN